MNILFLAHRMPYPPNKGEKIRAFNIFAHLAKTHVVHLACFVDDPADMKHVSKLRDMAGGECLFVPLRRRVALARMAWAFAAGTPLTTSYFSSDRLRRWVGELARAKRIDRVVAFSSAMAPVLTAQRDIDPARVILDMVDIDSDKWRQYAATARGPLSWIYRREARVLFELERKAASAFGATVFVSPHEAADFVDLAPETRERIFSVPNGVNLDYFAPAGRYPNPFGGDEIPIVMTGTMDYRPNEEGAAWFAQSMLPRVREMLPNARFYVVGANPTTALKSLAGPSVTVTGRVDDVRPYLSHAAVVAAPLRIARGVQNKVLEGMAMRRPVVATTHAARALAVEAGRELLIADEPDAFAEAVVDAATGSDRDRIAECGLRYVEEHHNWNRNLADLDRLLSTAPQVRAHAAQTTQSAVAQSRVFS